MSMRPLKWVFIVGFVMLNGWANGQKTGSKINVSVPKLSASDREMLKGMLNAVDKKFDDSVGMLINPIHGYQYHIDVTEGDYHGIRSSFQYALRLLDLEDAAQIGKACKIIKKCLSLQDTIATSKTCGIWGYYLEEPLATKKSPPDFNMADFNADDLLDIWMEHRHKLPQALQVQIKRSLELAAKSIMHRNVDLGYTNIAIKGTYVSFMVSHLFDNLFDIRTYSENKLDSFFAFTIRKNGFPEYNSPNYTPEALRDLNKMQMHIIDSKYKWKIDSIYNMAWSMIAKHWFAPVAQLAGPHSRSYSSILSPSFYSFLAESTDGKCKIPNIQGNRPKWEELGRFQQHVPPFISDYFFKPQYPRTETSVLEPEQPQIIGTTYLGQSYTIGTANRSSLWNQRRPCIAYWGTPTQPHYFQLRFLNNGYDFSSASFYSAQKENSFLAAINLNTGGGNKHISIDRIKTSKFTTSDLRIRFEFGNCKTVDNIVLPQEDGTDLALNMEGLPFSFQLYLANCSLGKGYWEKGHDEKNVWIDYVVFHGNERTVDLNKLENAFWGIGCTVGTNEKDNSKEKVTYQVGNDGNISASWKGMQISASEKVLPLPFHL